MPKVLVCHEIVRSALVTVTESELRVLKTHYRSKRGRCKHTKLAQAVIHRAINLEDDWAGTEIETQDGKTLFSVG